MTRLLDIFSSWNRMIQEGDLCPLFLLIWLLIYLGHFAVLDCPWQQIVGIRIAAAVVLVYAMIDLVAAGLRSPGDVLLIVIKAIAAGALVLGPCWMVLAVVGLAWSQLDQVRQRIRFRLQAAQFARQQRQRESSERERQRRAAIEWERARPERERAMREATERAHLDAERQRLERQRQAEEQQWRENVRYKIRLLYDRYAKELKTSISRRRFDEYFAIYLSDRYSAEEVERRGTLLQAMLLDTVKPEPPPRARRTLPDIQADFARRREEVLTLSLDQDEKAALVAELNREEDKAIREAMQQ